MKEAAICLVAFLISVSGLQAEIWNEEAKSFTEGKTYQFDYTSQVLSGLPKTSAEYSGLQINCLVELTFEAGSNVVMALKNVQFLETIKPVRTRVPYRFLKAKKLKIVKGMVDIKALALPVRFQWNIDAKILQMKTVPTDDAFSTNIKRGIVNMLNVKLLLNETNWKDEGGSYVNRDDLGIEGLCSAYYLWSSYPYKTPGTDDGNSRAVTITRTKSGNKCKTPAFSGRGNFVPVKMVNKEVDSNKTFVKTINDLSLNLTIWKSKKFFVWEAKSKSGYSILPEERGKEYVATFIMQSLKFVSKSGAPAPASAQVTKTSSVVMDMTMVEKKLTDADIMEIESLAKRLLKPTETVIPELIRLLRLAKEDDLKKISEKVRPLMKTNPEFRRQCLTVLANVFTEISVKRLIEVVVLKPTADKNDDMDTAKLISPMAGLSSLPDTKFIDLLTKAASKPELLTHKYRSNTLKTIWMTIGSLAGTYYSENPSYDIVSTIKYFKEIVPTLKTNLDKEETYVVIVKALGNIGAPQIFPYLEKVISNKTKKISVRVQAIYSLRKVQRTNPKIELFLLKIFSDVTEDVEIRLAAGLDICMRHTLRGSIHVLVSRLKREPIKQVRSFMQDLLLELSKIPRLQDTFKLASQRLKFQYFTGDYSRVYTMPTPTGMITIGAIYSPDSPNIRTANIAFYQFRFGKVFIPLEFGFRFQTAKNAKRYTSDSLMKMIYNFITVPAAERKKDSAIMTIYGKKFDNEVYFVNLGDEVGKKTEEMIKTFMKFLKGGKDLEVNRYLSLIMNWEINVPTTMGVKYSAQVDSLMDIRMGFNISYKPLNDSYKTKIKIRPFWNHQTVFNTGIDAGYIKSQVNMMLHLVSPNPIRFTVYANQAENSYGITVKNPKGSIHLLEHSFKKKFKTSYYMTLADNRPTTNFTQINPFYVAEQSLRKMKNKKIPMPFGMVANASYYCDVGKPRSDGVMRSLFSAGDAYASVWIKKVEESDFEEFKLDMSKSVFFGARNYTVSVKHVKKDKVHFKVDLARVEMKFGYGNSVKVYWPENLMQIFGVIATRATTSKEPKLNYIKATGSISFPKPIQFDVKSPLKIWTHLKEYSYGFSGTVENSKGKKIHDIEIRLGLGDESKEVAENIAKKTNRYAAHTMKLAQCVEDLDRKIPNSPSCLLAWLKLNYYNQLSVSLDSTPEGFERFKKLYTKYNMRRFVAKFLSSEKFSNETKTYTMKYEHLPYFNPASVATSSIFSLARLYKTVDKKRMRLVKYVIRRVSVNAVPEGFKSCQVRKGQGEWMSLKTFDGYYGYFKMPPKAKGTKKMIYVQDLSESFQISKIATEKEWAIQVIAKNMSVLKITKDLKSKKIEFKVDDKVPTTQNVMWKGKLVATMNQISQTVYGDVTLFEILLEGKDIRILTDMNELVNFEIGKKYKSVLRGMCGDMDGEVYNEFKNANCTAVYSTHEAMFKMSDYKLTSGSLTSYIPLKKCSRTEKLSLI